MCIGSRCTGCRCASRICVCVCARHAGAKRRCRCARCARARGVDVHVGCGSMHRWVCIGAGVLGAQERCRHMGCRCGARQHAGAQDAGAEGCRCRDEECRHVGLQARRVCVGAQWGARLVGAVGALLAGWGVQAGGGCRGSQRLGGWRGVRGVDGNGVPLCNGSDVQPCGAELVVPCL